MGYCKNRGPHSPTMVALLYSSVALGALLCFLVAMFSAYKYHIQMDKQERNQLLSRLLFVITLSMVVERSVRVYGTYLSFHGSEFSETVVHYANSLCFLCGIVTAILLDLITKLVTCFEQSIYKVTREERRISYTLGTATLICVSVILTLDGINSARNSLWMKIILNVFSVGALMNYVCFILRVDHAFVSRLRLIVASQNIQRGTLERIDTEQTTHQPTLSNVMLSTISHYAITEQHLLIVAAKSTVSAVWISVGSLLCFIGFVFFIFGECADLANVLGHLLFAIGYPTMGLAIVLTLKDSDREYQQCCHSCQRLTGKYVAFRTDRKIVKMARKETSQASSSQNRSSNE